MAQELPVANPSFEETGKRPGTIPGWTTFSNAYLSTETASDGTNSLLTYGCFCGDYQASGAFTTDYTDVDPGQIVRCTADLLSPSFDSIKGNSNWAGLKVEFVGEDGNIVQLGEARVLDGLDPAMIEDEWVEGSLLAIAPEFAVKARVVCIFFQYFGEPGAVWFDNIQLEVADRNPDLPLINPSLEGLWNGQFNGWYMYANCFGEYFPVRSGCCSAKMFGPYNKDGSGQSGINQYVQGVVTEGEAWTGSAWVQTPDFDTIKGGTNQFWLIVEFFDGKGNYLGGELEIGLDGQDPDLVENEWVLVQTTAVAPKGAVDVQLVCQINQENSSAGAVWVDDGSLVRGGDPGPDDCREDINGDGIVDGEDLGALLGNWNTADPAADIDQSGIVDGVDLGMLLGAWGQKCEDEPPASNCFEAQVDAGCADPVCQEIVCAIDAFCCEVQWDQSCADKAIANCGG
ncbi:MAG: hypothetical protein CMJ32_07750 [Phycisphaerae bacterium]|nr:hypothetical protein [Phycisphaerae bacterium]